MMLKGFRVRRSKTVGYRMSIIGQDFDRTGEQVPTNYVSFVKISDCEIYEENGKKYYKAADAKSIPIHHFGTFYGAGELRKSTKMFGVVEWYRVVYFVWDGKVYTSRITYPDDQVENQKLSESRDKEAAKNAIRKRKSVASV